MKLHLGIARTSIASLLLGAAFLACAPGDRADRADRGTALAASLPTSGTVVDSILPLDEALRRFREGLPEVGALEGGAPSRDALVERFTTGVAANDTAALAGLFLSRAEFAWLYYPESPYSREPTRQMANVAWLMLRTQSEKGISRVLQRYGGRPGALGAHACRGEPERHGESLLWTDCTVRVATKDGTADLRLFAAILERGGRFKFQSYQNDL